MKWYERIKDREDFPNTIGWNKGYQFQGEEHNSLVHEKNTYRIHKLENVKEIKK